MKKRYNYLKILAFLLFSTSIYGQQQAAFSLYNQFAGVYNPSAIPDEYTNHEHNIIIGANARTQWMNISSGPKTQSLKGEYITNDANNTFNLLMGSYILNDQAGPISTTGMYFRIAGIMSDYSPTYGGISAGLQIGAIQYRINTLTLHEKYPTDILTTENTQTTKPQLSLGITYYNQFGKTKMNTGVSMTHVGFGDFKFKDELTEFGFQTNLHLYGYGKVKRSFGESQALELNTWVRYVKNTPLNLDVHLVFEMNEILSFEVGTNSSGIGHVGFGVNLLDIFGSSFEDLIHLNYSYNPNVLKAGSVFGNTHEIHLAYSFKR